MEKPYLWLAIVILIFGAIPKVRAQVPAKSGLGLVDNLKINALTSKEGVTGEIIAKDMNPSLTTDSEDQCPSDEESKKKKKELVLIFTGEINTRPDVKVNGQDVELPDLYDFDSSNSEYKNLLSKSPDKIWGLANALGQQNQADRVTNLGVLLLVGASQMYSRDKVNDQTYNASVNQMMADKVKALNLTRDEQIKLIASMSELLYTNYNDPRNVTPESDNNPRYWTSQAYGVFQNSPNSGGVCDDISFLGCQLYGALNPGEDCLTMHSSGVGGTQHFVMMLGNKGTRNYTTINGSYVENTQGSNYISMDPASPLGADGGINIRLNGIVDGKHKSYSVLKNEYGQWMQKVMNQPGSPGTSIVSDIDGTLLQNLGAAFEKHQNSGKGKIESTKKYGINQGVLSNGSQMVAVYALIDKTTPKKKMGIGFGLNYTNFSKAKPPREISFVTEDNELMNSKFEIDYNNHINRLHINPYYGLGNVHKFSQGNNEIKIHYLNGVYANILAGLQVTSETIKSTSNVLSPEGEVLKTYSHEYKYNQPGIIFDGNLGLSQKAGIDISNNNGTDVKLGVQLTEELGPSDWNKVHGMRSSFLQSMKNMTFFLNRVEVKADLNQKIDEKKTFIAGAQYLGTNVGQNLLTQAGLKFQIPNDMEVYILTGYGAEFGGYKTNQNYLPVSNNTGISLKSGVVSPSGLNVGAGIRYDKNSVDPLSTQVQATIPIKPKKKKKP